MSIYRYYMRINSIMNKSSFIVQLSKLMTGTAITQVITLISLPLLAKFYSPADYGSLAIYSSILAIVGVMATGRYEAAIILPRSDLHAFYLGILSMIIVSCVTVFVIIIEWILSTLFFFVIDLSLLLYLIPIGVFFSGINGIQMFWLNRKCMYGSISKLRIIQGLVTILGCFILGIYGISFGLIIGTLLGSIISNSIFLIVFFLNNTNFFRTISLKKIYVLAKQYKRYPLYSIWGAIFNVSSYHIENFLFLFYFGQGVVGSYFFATRCLGAIKAYLASSIWQIFIGTVKGKSHSFILQKMEYYQNVLVKFITLPMLSILFISEDLWLLLFSNTWYASLTYMQILMFLIYINIIVSSFSLFLIINKPEAEMKFNFWLLFSKIIIICGGFYLFNDLLDIVKILTIIHIILFIGLGSWNYQQLGKDWTYFIFKYYLWIKKFGLHLIAIIIIANFPLVWTKKAFLYILINLFMLLKWRKLHENL